jgi:E3 ubiquitin-protein ligase RAD18
MTVQAVEAHIDKCDGISLGKKRAATNSIQLSSLRKPATRPERLPHPHYSGLKDTALRKKLIDQGISSSGSRKLLEGRYTEWVTLWNANCDSKSPKGKVELKKELDIWEKTHGGRATLGGRGQITGAQIKHKDFDGKAWADKNADAFNELIANARKPVAKTMVSEPATTQGDAADGPTQTSLPPQADLAVFNGGPEGVESPINTQIDTQQAPPIDPTAPIQPSQYQSTPIFDSDTATSPDIDTTKPLQL